MPHFKNIKYGYFISVNFKVMYSTMRTQKHLKKVKLFWLLFSKKDKYILVRNPYERLESFYRDKLGKHLVESNKWARSQKIFFRPLGIKNKNTHEKFKQLSNLSFESFIKLLPEVYTKNRHLHPQNRMFKKVNHTKVLYMEKKEDLLFLAENLHLDLNIKANTTDKSKHHLEWKPQMISIVNKLYAEDFKLYNFERK